MAGRISPTALFPLTDGMESNMSLVVENHTHYPYTVNLSQYDKTGRPVNERLLLINLGRNEEGPKFTKEMWAEARKRPRIQQLLDDRGLVEHWIDDLKAKKAKVK